MTVSVSGIDVDYNPSAETLWWPANMPVPGSNVTITLSWEGNSIQRVVEDWEPGDRFGAKVLTLRRPTGADGERFG